MVSSAGCSADEEGEEGRAVPSAAERSNQTVTAGSLRQARLTTAGLGPIKLGETLAEIASSTGAELVEDACDYQINPGGYLNVVLEIGVNEAGEQVLEGLLLYDHPGGVPSITPTTRTGLSFGSSEENVLRSHPGARRLLQDEAGDYWLLEAEGEDRELVAVLRDGEVTGLGVGNSEELLEANCF